MKRPERMSEDVFRSLDINAMPELWAEADRARKSELRLLEVLEVVATRFGPLFAELARQGSRRAAGLQRRIAREIERARSIR